MRATSLCVLGLAALAAVVGSAEPANAAMVGEIYAPGTPTSGDFVLAGTNPGKWGPAADGTGAIVTYSFMPAGIPLDSGVSVDLNTFMPAGFKAEIVRAFDAWSDVANITFLEVVDSGGAFNSAAGAIADIRIAGHFFDGPFGTLAHAFFPPVNGLTAAGDLHFDSSELWKIGFGGAGFDIFQVAAHEIGHSIGLDHTGVANSLMNPFYTEVFSGPQADDIAGAQFIYGPAAVPEPSSLVLCLFAAGPALVALRRRKKAAAQDATLAA
jgi:hypothetical protein